MAVLTAEAFRMVRAAECFEDLGKNALVAGVAKVAGLDAVLADRQSLLVQTDGFLSGREESTTLRAAEALFMVTLTAHHQMALVQNAITARTARSRMALLAKESVPQEGAIRGIDIPIAFTAAVTLLVEGAIMVFIFVIVTHRVAATSALWMSSTVILALDHHKQRRIQGFGTVL